MDLDPKSALEGQCTPLTQTPTKSPSPKNIYTIEPKMREEVVSIAVILKAINGLIYCFHEFEQMIIKSKVKITTMQENETWPGIQCKGTDDTVKITTMQESQEEMEGFSSQWNRCLLNPREQ